MIFFFTHNSMLFISPTIIHKMTQISDPQKQGTSWSLHSHEPFFLFHSSTNYNDTKKTQLNPKTSIPGLKPNLNPVWDYPKTVPKTLSGLSKNNPENSAQTVRKQSQKFSPNCLKTIPKIQPGLSENNPKNS